MYDKNNMFAEKNDVYIKYKFRLERYRWKNVSVVNNESDKICHVKK